jgi:hypothetical protein
VELNVAQWEPPAELMRLLEALAADVVGATDADVAIGNTDDTTLTSTLTSLRKIHALEVRMRLLIGDAIDEPAGMKERLVLPEPHVVSELRQRSH